MLSGFFSRARGKCCSFRKKCQAVAAFSALACRRRSPSVSSDRAVGEVEALCLMLLQTVLWNVTVMTSIIFTASGQTPVKWTSLIPQTPTEGTLKSLNPLGINFLPVSCVIYRLFS